VPGIVVHTAISALRRIRQEFKASLCYIATPCLKKKESFFSETLRWK
jgi:hypothetical protein